MGRDFIETSLKEKNIMILTTKLSNGGAEKAASLLANNLSKKYNVYLTVFDNSTQDYETNVDIIDLKTRITSNIFKKIFNFIKRICLLKKIKKEYKIDCTISFLTGPNLVNVLSKEKDKTIVSIRNNIKAKGKIHILVNKYVMKKADKVVTVSKDMREYYIKKYKISPKKVCAIYNVCDSNDISIKAEEKIDKYQEIFEYEKVVISLGRFIKQKGMWHLIRAFSKIVKENLDFKLVIFGRGKERKDLQKLVDELELNKSVFLLDYVSNPYKYLKKSKIFVNSSLYEGCSNAILEAMCVGLPIVATDCKYGNREILCLNNSNEEFGILVPALDNKYYNSKDPLTKEEIELYEAIKKLIKDENLREYYRQKSKERIKYFLDNTEEWQECIEKD